MEKNTHQDNRSNIPIEDQLTRLDFSQGIYLDENDNIVRNKGVIYDCYLCVRPGNKINVPKVNRKLIKHNRQSKEITIVNNYGHGGIGWSLVWGSVLKSIEFSQILKQEILKDLNMIPSKSKIAIIGSGANGLATALMLVEKGINPNLITIFSSNIDDTTSHRSGAILSTASVLEKIDPELEKIYDEINLETFKVWQNIHQGKIFKKLQNGIKKVKAYFGAEKEWGTIETDSGLDIFVKNGLIPPPELVQIKFGERLNLMRRYDSYYFNTYRLMRGLFDYVSNDFKIKIVKREIQDYDELINNETFDYIFNCAGLSNQKKFNFDKDILPIGGHIITLKHQNIHEFDYVIYSHYIHKEDIGKYNYTNAPLFYLMLKTDDNNFSGLLGGSLLNNYEGGDQKKDEGEFKEILRRTLEIFGEDLQKHFIKSSPVKPKF